MTGATHAHQLLSLMNFWKIKYPGKWLYGLGLPALLALTSAAVFHVVPEANIAHERGLLDVSSGLLSMLVGFFVAALGLTLTIASQSLDELPKHTAPELDGKPLTWRTFARTVTSYLVVASLLTYCTAVTALTFHPVAEGIDGHARMIARTVVGGLYVGMFTHVVSITAFALFLVAKKLPEVAEESAGSKKSPPAPKSQEEKTAGEAGA